MQRLFSTFPLGPPGVGLVLLRVAVAVPLTHATIAILMDGTIPAAFALLIAVVALLLLIGLWTPLAGAALAIGALSLSLANPFHGRWTFIQLAVLGAALVLLGPGGWSVDARLFGRKHIQIPPR